MSDDVGVGDHVMRLPQHIIKLHKFMLHLYDWQQGRPTFLGELTAFCFTVLEEEMLVILAFQRPKCEHVSFSLSISPSMPSGHTTDMSRQLSDCA